MTEDAFLKAIHADPDDVASRLVYADWLEENGGPAELARAEFIRVQIEAEGLKRGKRRTELEKRARELLAAHPEWTPAVTKGGIVARPVFRGGFLHGVTVAASRFPSVAKKLFKAAPTVRAAVFPEASNEVAELAACKYLARLAEADLSDMCSCGWCPIEEDLAALFASPHAGGLVRLNLSGDRMDADGAEALAASKAFPRLRELDLSNNRLGNAGARALLKAPWLEHLERLDLRGNGIGVRAGAMLRKRLGDAAVL